MRHGFRRSAARKVDGPNVVYNVENHLHRLADRSAAIDRSMAMTDSRRTSESVTSHCLAAITGSTPSRVRPSRVRLDCPRSWTYTHRIADRRRETMIPIFLLNQVYRPGSLRKANGIRFEIVNRLVDIQLVTLRLLAIDGEPIPLEQVKLEVAAIGEPSPSRQDGVQPFPLPLNTTVAVLIAGRKLAVTRHKLDIGFDSPVWQRSVLRRG